MKQLEKYLDLNYMASKFHWIILFGFLVAAIRIAFSAEIPNFEKSPLPKSGFIYFSVLEEDELTDYESRIRIDNLVKDMEQIRKDHPTAKFSTIVFD